MAIPSIAVHTYQRSRTLEFDCQPVKRVSIMQGAGHAWTCEHRSTVIGILRVLDNLNRYSVRRKGGQVYISNQS